MTVKAQPDSLGSRWLIDNLKPGMQLKAMGPAGVFTLPRQPDGKYLFVSAGSGITPVMSMLAFLYDRGEQPDVTFIYCAQRPSDLIFRRRLEQMASRVPGIRLHFVVTEEEPFEIWTGFQAPVENAADLPEHDDVVPDEAEPAELVFATSGVTTGCHQTDTVLAIAKSSGLNIPSGCTFGVCGTCKIRKLSGEVHMVHNGGIAEEDIEAGFILACCSKPIGRVEVAV